MIGPLFQIKIEKITDNFGHFIIEPLAQGYGHTLGNSLRRVLLSGLKGAALTSAKFSNAKHKFSTIEGLKEDVIELSLSLKQIRFQYSSDKPVSLILEKSGQGEIKAGDIKVPANVKIINPDLVLGHLSGKSSKLKMELTLESGFGYVPAEEHKSDKLGVIGLDSIFSPVTRVNYKVEATRVGRQTDLDSLVLEIFTDGTLKADAALKEAASILVGYYQQLLDPKKAARKEETSKSTASDEVMRFTLEEINLPTRVTNALRKSGYGTVGDLSQATLDDLRKVKNLGDKSIELVRKVLAKKGLNLKES